MEEYAARFDELFGSLAQRRGFREYLQAARKRFTDPTTAAPTPVLPPEVTLRPRLRTCLTRADELAQRRIRAKHCATHGGRRVLYLQLTR